MKLVERFTRIDADTLEYEFTVTDPETWTAPWTAQIPMRLNDLTLFEYACHEGTIPWKVSSQGVVPKRGPQSTTRDRRQGPQAAA